MSETLDLVSRLTERELPFAQRRGVLQEFASSTGWRPSDAIEDYPGLENLSNGHLLVEHGVETAAVISFLKSGVPFSALSHSHRIAILELSYNHLIDWHLFPDRTGITTVFNRSDPLVVRHHSIHESTDLYRVESFDRITGRRPTPNVRALDDALIGTISSWKRTLGSDLGDAVTNENISALFNLILFLRALEDHRRWQGAKLGRVLQGVFAAWPENRVALNNAFKQALLGLELPEVPEILQEELRSLGVLSELPRETASAIIRDFYTSRFSPYTYDFNLISKHALSRVYEHYVSLLREPESAQLRMFQPFPEEFSNRAIGGVYTPQYVARFFARYLKENLTPPSFRTLRTIDPACGSGIFLRTLLEMQCDPLQSSGVREVTTEAFSRTVGIDVDPNASRAAKLSLSLLYLVLTDRFPERLSIVNAEALEFLSERPDLRGQFDVVIGNPPFVKWDRLPQEMRDRVVVASADVAGGKVDLYLAVLLSSIGLVKEGGFLAFVLPHSFLFAKSAGRVRQRIARDFWVRCLADLSEIDVFESGAYVVLLIIQRRQPNLPEPPASIARCKDFVANALQSLLDGKSVANDFYHVYEVDQREFAGSEWRILPPAEGRLRARIEQFDPLEDFVHVREGMVTGADSVFVRPSRDVPHAEREIYLPMLSDREMRRYDTPKRTGQLVFYPFVGDEQLTEAHLKKRFPETWAYLKAHSKKLRERRSVIAGTVPWWRPERPRKPSSMRRPKLVTPHLILLPRFSFDADGRYAVSHSPFLVAKEEGNEAELLQFIVAVLNSSACHWQITQTSHKYRRGYLMLEPKTLRGLRIPSPTGVSTRVMAQIQSLVGARLGGSAAPSIEAQLDDLVANLYGLSADERREVGMEAVEGADHGE